MSVTAQLPGSASLAGAYARCERLARDHYENFPVASRLLPSPMRPHVAAVYAFARVADDLADEGARPATERQQLLDDWLGRLQHVAGQFSAGKPVDSGDEDAAAIFLALGHTIRECRLPAAPFEDLLCAFRQDTWKTRYETFDEVLDYCRRSANPVGRLVLRIAGYDDPRIDTASDGVCTALQLANFWQDLERDWQRGRLYVPLEEIRAAGASELDLDRRHVTGAWRDLISSLVARTRAIFLRGRPVADMVRGRLRIELRLTWLGGIRILEQLECHGFDVFGHRPMLGSRDVPVLLWRAASWRTGIQGPSERARSSAIDSERVPTSDPRERSGDRGVPARERAGRSGGAKPPGTA